MSTHWVREERRAAGLCCCSGCGRERRDGGGRNRAVDDDDREDRRADAVGQALLGILRDAGQAADLLEAGVADHRDRERERQGVPGRHRAEVDAVLERVDREQEHEPEDRDPDLDDQVERGDEDADRVGVGAPQHADDRDDEDDRDRAHRRAAGLAAEPSVLPQRAGEVVRQEERRERDREHEVEHRRPPGDEAHQVVERPPGEGRRAARLGDRRPALGIRRGREREEEARGGEDDRRQRERVDRGDAERVVERARDLAVGHRVQRPDAQEPAERRDLARHRGELSLRPRLPASRRSGRRGTPCRRPGRELERAPVLLERLGASAEPAEHVGAGGRQEVVPGERRL